MILEGQNSRTTGSVALVDTTQRMSQSVLTYRGRARTVLKRAGSLIATHPYMGVEMAVIA